MGQETSEPPPPPRTTLSTSQSFPPRRCGGSGGTGPGGAEGRSGRRSCPGPGPGPREVCESSRRRASSPGSSLLSGQLGGGEGRCTGRASGCSSAGLGACFRAGSLPVSNPCSHAPAAGSCSRLPRAASSREETAVTFAQRGSPELRHKNIKR